MRSGRWILALDVGGTNMVAALIHEDGGDPVGLRTRSTPADQGPAALADAAVDLLAQVRTVGTSGGIAANQIVGVGVGVPGAVDAVRGIVFLAPNLGWRDVPIRDLLQDRLELPVVVDNDANCAALGEWWTGAGRGSRLLVTATLGTGIGGGIVRDGRVLRGVSGAAGEIGHMVVQVVGGRACSCGSDGCLEAYASGTAIRARAREALADGTPSRIQEIVQGGVERVTAQEVAQAAREGDELALRLIRETASFLGAGLASLVNILNPDRIVLAGGVMQAGDLLLLPVREEVRRRAFEASSEACVIAAAREPETAGVRGAALTFRREVLEGHR